MLPTLGTNTTCRLPADPSANPGLELVEAFPNATFNTPIFLTHAGDGGGRIFVVERGGTVRVLAGPNDASADVFLDVNATGVPPDLNSEMGLLGFAFHPDFETNGFVYASWVTTTGGPRRSRISRFQADPPTAGSIDAATEEVVLEVEQPYGNHNGGMIAFGPDGYLYIGLGDGGSANDPLGHGQNTDTLLGSILRIDVDTATGGNEYGIPPGNPFENGVGGAPEICAWGFRNPWRFSFDRLTGVMWIGDVGQGTREEISLLDGCGGNYGWNTMEGFLCFQGADCDQTGLTLPLADYPRSVGESITGGYVYRGSEVPSLYGAYIYADYDLDQLFIWRAGEEPIPDVGAYTVGQIGSFGEDEAGEVYVIPLFGDVIQRFAETDPGPAPEPFPETLSATGCFSDTANLVPAPGVAPYETSSPLWSDGALKRRWVALPEGGKLTYDDTGKWTAPTGTVFLKHFEIEFEEGNASTTKRLETRVIVQDDDGIRGYTYRWRADGSDADLLSGADAEPLSIETGAGTAAVNWQYPSRQQCRSCHTVVSGGLLGLESRQLNGDTNYPGGFVGNQIEALLAWDLLDPAPAPGAVPAGWPAVDDDDAPVGTRVRAWMHSNCAHCHMDGANNGVDLDLRFDTPLADTGLCLTPPDKGNLGIVGGLLLDPGDHTNSLVWHRLSATPPQQMPPLAVSRLDQAAADAMATWIDGLAGCD